LFGHIGIVNGIIALIIGGFLFWLSRQEIISTLKTILAGILMIVVGHLGAVMGALLVGTAGVLMCYIAGIWHIVLGIKSMLIKKKLKN